MKFKYDVYCAGSMHGRLGQDVINERSQVAALCKTYGLSYYDPASDEDIKGNRIIDKTPSRKRMHHYVTKDDLNLDKCRTLLVLTGDKSSAGTGWEMGRMFYRNHRPIVVVAPRMFDGSLTNFTTIKATKIVATQKQAVSWIRRKLK